KGAQVGVTSVVMLKTLHGLISGRYPQGALYLFPSRIDVQDFSRGRFNPLINDNDSVSRFVQDTDSQTIKRIGKSMLYLRGARSTGKAGGMKRSSSQLKSIPVDRVVFDEADEMEPAMIDLALERLSHSSLKEEICLSTPTIPDYGVDKLFQGSDQRHWFIRCSKCGGDTCLELEFPNCLEELADKRVIRLCQRCRDNEVHPVDGHWEALCPDGAKDMVGWRISQLNSAFVEPGKILRLYRDPPGGNLTEVYNSKLAQAHVAAENRLTVPEVIGLCGDELVAETDPGPCYLGADEGKLIHVVIGKRHRDKDGQLVYVSSFPDWSQLDGLMKRFNVVRAVIDALPETRLAREFAREHQGKVYLSYYSEHQKGSYAWSDREMTVTANRTEALDASHNELSQGKVLLPRESETLHEFARHCANVARVLQANQETGSTRYVYLKTGDDHYRHAQSYECMARHNCPELLFPNI
ncbi:phage terminase large subunit family protein, partial [Gemmatimonadota bacterium]